MAAYTGSTICGDFLEFQDALKKMRSIDDKIVYALNTTIPTNSFRNQVNVTNQCKGLYEQLQESYQHREVVIKKCITEVSERVRVLNEQRKVNESDPNISKLLRKEQTKLRLMQSEVNVEEVVKDRSLKIFYEKCRSAYKPSDLHV
ncbi:hypothetical protein CHUAL_013230 [Chamberlinius hualienensis]